MRARAVIALPPPSDDASRTSSGCSGSAAWSAEAWALQNARLPNTSSASAWTSPLPLVADSCASQASCISVYLTMLPDTVSEGKECSAQLTANNWSMCKKFGDKCILQAEDTNAIDAGSPQVVNRQPRLPSKIQSQSNQREECMERFSAERAAEQQSRVDDAHCQLRKGQSLPTVYPVVRRWRAYRADVR